MSKQLLEKLAESWGEKMHLFQSYHKKSHTLVDPTPPSTSMVNIELINFA
jgi:hypothetical protein